MRKEWGTFITSQPTPALARRTILDLNRRLSKLPIPEEIKLGVMFEVHPTFDNVRGRPWYWGIYATLDERATRAVSNLYTGGDPNIILVGGLDVGHLLFRRRTID